MRTLFKIVVLGALVTILSLDSVLAYDFDSKNFPSAEFQKITSEEKLRKQSAEWIFKTNGILNNLENSKLETLNKQYSNYQGKNNVLKTKYQYIQAKTYLLINFNTNVDKNLDIPDDVLNTIKNLNASDVDKNTLITIRSNLDKFLKKRTKNQLDLIENWYPQEQKNNKIYLAKVNLMASLTGGMGGSTEIIAIRDAENLIAKTELTYTYVKTDVLNQFNRSSEYAKQRLIKELIYSYENHLPLESINLLKIDIYTPEILNSYESIKYDINYNPIVYVNGYIDSTGNIIKGHYRTSPDATTLNNFSLKGNVNPFTGEVGTK